MDHCELMTRLLKEASDRINTDFDSFTVERIALDPTVEGPLNRMERLGRMEDALNQLTNTLDVQVAQVTEGSLIGIMENIDGDHNMSLVRGVLKKATRAMLMSMMYDGGVHEAFEVTIVEVAASV